MGINDKELKVTVTQFDNYWEARLEQLPPSGLGNTPIDALSDLWKHLLGMPILLEKILNQAGIYWKA